MQVTQSIKNESKLTETHGNNGKVSQRKGRIRFVTSAMNKNRFLFSVLEMYYFVWLSVTFEKSAAWNKRENSRDGLWNQKKYIQPNLVISS